MALRGQLHSYSVLSLSKLELADHIFDSRCRMGTGPSGNWLLIRMPEEESVSFWSWLLSLMAQPQPNANMQVTSQSATSRLRVYPLYGLKPCHLLVMGRIQATGPGSLARCGFFSVTQ